MAPHTKDWSLQLGQDFQASAYLNQSATKLSSSQRQDQVPEVDSSDQVLLIRRQELDDGVALVVADDAPEAEDLQRLRKELLQQD